MYRIAIIIMLLVGCQSDNKDHDFWVIDRDETLYIGDSNATGYKIEEPTAQQMTRIDYDAKGWRKMIDYTDQLPGSEEGIITIFLALGVNDAATRVPIDEYTQSLQNKLASTDAHIYCVLPIVHSIFDELMQPYADAMLNNCTDTINPREYGVCILFGRSNTLDRKESL